MKKDSIKATEPESSTPVLSDPDLSNPGLLKRTSARQEFFAGARAIIPLVVGATPFGILFGTLAISVGLSIWATMGLSLIVFAGSSQFVAAGLVGQGASIGIIVLTTFVVNLRHGLYAASLGPYLRHLSHRWLAPMAFLLTDEAYAAVISRFEKADSSPNKHWFYMGGALFMYVNWQLWTLVGIVAGQRIQGAEELGLEFAMVVTFIGIVVPLIKQWPMLVCALTAGGAALLFHGLPHQLGLIVASVIGIAAGLLVQKVTASEDVSAEPASHDASGVTPGVTSGVTSGVRSKDK